MAPSLKKHELLILMDVDGTLTPHRQRIQPEVERFLHDVASQHATLGLVSGSDLKKLSEQMGGDQVLHQFEYVFPENGLVAYHNGQLVAEQSIEKHLGEDKLQRFINFCLKYMSELQLPCKRGTFVEFRTGMINVCPVGRSCSLAERQAFAAYDAEHKVREKFRAALEQEFPDLGLHFAIGGQISMDAFPVGWDKRFCLTHVEARDFKEIHFFGDRTQPGGNDHELYEHESTVGHAVTSPQDTVAQIKKLLNLED